LSKGVIVQPFQLTDFPKEKKKPDRPLYLIQKKKNKGRKRKKKGPRQNKLIRLESPLGRPAINHEEKEDAPKLSRGPKGNNFHNQGGGGDRTMGMTRTILAKSGFRGKNKREPFRTKQSLIS